MAPPRWLPLESNPDVMNRFAKGLGLTGAFSYTDVYGLDPELLAMVPQPVHSALLLFPCSEAHGKHKREQEEKIKADGQKVSDKVFFLKQTIGNACGTIGILHSLGNSQDVITLEDGYLKTFFAETAAMTPEARGAKVTFGAVDDLVAGCFLVLIRAHSTPLSLEESDGIGEAHEASAQEGQTEAPSLEDNVNLHFIAFAQVEGDLYELDGTKAFPINHGPTSEATFLSDVARVTKEFMARDPDSYQFTVVALAKTD